MELVNLTNRKAHILVVDDNPANLQLASSILKLKSYDVTTALGGNQALEMLKTIKPDLILLDIMMPDLNGYEVCERVKNDPLTSDIPVIFLSAIKHTESIIKGISIGAVDYISKPFNKDELLVRVKTHIKLKLSTDIIKKQNQKLERLNEEKNSLMQITAHDLKNPLQGVMGLLEILQIHRDKLDDNDIGDMINSAQRAIDQAFKIITDLQEVQTIEEGKVVLRFAKVLAIDSINKVIASFEQRAKAKKIELVFNHKNLLENQSFINGALYIDHDKFVRILDNLISNAIKFSSSEKKVTINLERITENSSDFLRIGISDQGPGISEKDMQKLFTKFAKLSARPTAGETSSGLGLSIAKQLTEAMNGKIWAESTLGEGAVFYLQFPVHTQ